MSYIGFKSCDKTQSTPRVDAEREDAGRCLWEGVSAMIATLWRSYITGGCITIIPPLNSCGLFRAFGIVLWRAVHMVSFALDGNTILSCSGAVESGFSL